MDHERIDELLDRAQLAPDEDGRRPLLEQVRQELELHVVIEETVLYPKFAAKEGFGGLIERFAQEHRQVRALMEDVLRAGGEGELETRLQELKERFRRHAKDEEEDLFPLIEKSLDTVQLMQLGDQLTDARSSLPEAA